MSVEDARRSGDAEGNDGRDERQRRRQQLREVQGQWLQKPVVGRQKQRLKRDSGERRSSRRDGVELAEGERRSVGRQRQCGR